MTKRAKHKQTKVLTSGEGYIGGSERCSEVKRNQRGLQIHPEEFKHCCWRSNELKTHLDIHIQINPDWRE